MATETHTGRLVFGDGQVAVVDDDGNATVLAVTGPNPCATAAGRFAKWGPADPVTVTGTTGTVDKSPVLYVTSIQWAEQASAAVVGNFSTGGVTSVAQDAPAVAAPPAMAQPATKKAAQKPPKKAAAKTAAKKSTAAKPTGSRSKK